MNLLQLATSPLLRQLLLLGIVVLVPLFAVFTGRDRLLSGWIVLASCIDIFHLHLGLNFPAAPFAGLCLVPRNAHYLRKLLRIRSGRALALHFTYLVLTGIVFGFLMPWSNEGVFRLFNETAQGRSIIYLIHQFGSLNLTVFLASYIQSRARLLEFLCDICRFATIAAVAGIAEFATRIDFYGLLTGLPSQDLLQRVHGLNYEPRGLGLIAAHGLLLSLLFLTRRFRWSMLGAALLNTVAIGLTLSTSALFAVLAAFIALAFFDRRMRPLVLIAGLGASLAAPLLLVSPSPWLRNWLSHTESRITATHTDTRATDWVTSLALRTEVYDGSALMFFDSHPWYLLSGTGPGLISLPATRYVPARAEYQAIWTSAEGQGVNSPPTIGFLLEISNAGLPGLLLWLLFAIAGWRGLGRLAQEDWAWSVARSTFLFAGVLYLVQASPVTPISFLLFSLAISAEGLARSQRRDPAYLRPRLPAPAFMEPRPT